MLHSQCYGRAKDLCRTIADDDLITENGVKLIINAVYRKDPLAIVREVYHDFMELLSTKRGDKEGYPNFESRFQAQLAKFNSHFDDLVLSDALMAFLLLGNANIEQSQKISILAACSPKLESSNEIVTSEDALKMVSYE